MTKDALIRRYGKNLVERVIALINKANAHDIKIATAESLTAGGIAHLLDSLDTEQRVLSCGRAVYNNNAKADMLGVSREDLEKYEAVSEPVARQMAEGALTSSDAQIAVAVTGYAGQWGDPTRNIDGGTIFIGISHKLHDTCATHVEELHFDKARSLDIRKTIIAAVSALEMAIEAQIEQKSALKNTVCKAIQEGALHDPWLLSTEHTQERSGETSDPLLIQEYGADIIERIKKLHTQSVKGNHKIAIAGDALVSEMAHMLTTLNGSSKVVDRAYIMPNAAIQQRLLGQQVPLLPEENAEAMATWLVKQTPATIVISMFKLNENSAICVVATEKNTKAQVINFSGQEALSRQAATQMLGILEQALESTKNLNK